jgi:hypothetical protein
VIKERKITKKRKIEIEGGVSGIDIGLQKK